MVLESLLVYISDNCDFDKLVIFFCVVFIDIVIGEKVVFCKGYLFQVICVSMLIFVVFVLVEIDGRLLVDGGMVDNILVDVVCDMGVDVVIVVDIGNLLCDCKDLSIVFDVMNQLIILMIWKNFEVQLVMFKFGDVLIQLLLFGYGIIDFGCVL